MSGLFTSFEARIESVGVKLGLFTTFKARIER